MIIILCPKCRSDNISKYNEENHKRGLICNECGAVFSSGINVIHERESLSKYMRSIN
jgi:transcription initiation factor TFIIIB Brf1 subunit/transcription initiation factor TFIIB